MTIKLKAYRWSDGEEVSARDVVFWIDLLRANRYHWASYVPGGFPDNVVVLAAATGRATVQLRLNASYNPIWFTYNELSQITPLPIAWDRTSLSAPPLAQAAHLPGHHPGRGEGRLQLPQLQATKHRRPMRRARSGRSSTAPGS